MASPTSLSPAEQSLIWSTPYVRPPAGQTANFVDPPNERSTTIAVLTVEGIFIVLPFLVRLHTAAGLRRRVRWEDGFVTVAVAMYVASIVLASIGVRQGFGVHLWDMSTGTLSQLLQLANIIEILYGFCILFVKLAILLQFRHFFVPPRRRGGRRSLLACILHVFIATHTTFYVVHILIFITGCRPRAYFWNRMIQGTCVDIDAVIIASATINVVSDFAILILPIYPIWRLNTSRRRKYGLLCIFFVGALGCSASILRARSSFLFIQEDDMTYHIYWMGLWAGVEVSCGILAANVPYFPPAFRALWPGRRADCATDSDETIQALETDSDETLKVLPTGTSSDTARVSGGDEEKAIVTIIVGAAQLPPPPPPLRPRPDSMAIEPAPPLKRLEEEPPESPEESLEFTEEQLEMLFVPATPAGPETRRHVLERGHEPGRIVGLMRAQEQACALSAALAATPEPLRAADTHTPVVASEARGW